MLEESSYIREPRSVFSGITSLPPISSIRINMFKLFVFIAFLAFAAAAPAPAPGAVFSAPLVTSYSAPIVSSLGTPLAYSAYSAPLAYSAYASPYSYALPYAYKAGYYV